MKKHLIILSFLFGVAGIILATSLLDGIVIYSKSSFPFYFVFLNIGVYVLGIGAIWLSVDEYKAEKKNILPIRIIIDISAALGFLTFLGSFIATMIMVFK